MMRDNKEGIEARVPVKKRKNTSIDSFFNRVSFLLASLPSPPPLPFSKGKKKRRKKRKNTCECYDVHFENIHAYEKAHIRKDTHTHSLFHMDLHSDIPRTMLRIIIIIIIIIPRDGNWILLGKKKNLTLDRR